MNYLLLDPQNISGDTAHVTKSYQVKHLKEVLKAGAGKQIRVAELGGLVGTAQVASISQNEAKLAGVVLDTKPPPKLPITLIIAMPRPKALRRLISDVVAMGVSEVFIIHSYRVEKSYWQTPFLGKLDDYVQLGLEQAGDSVPPRIHLKKRFKPFVEDELPTIIRGRQALLAHPTKDDNDKQNVPAGLAERSDVVIIVGAEGGFICYEVDLLTAHGCKQVSLGRRILRSETAVSMMVGQLVARQ